MTESLNSGSFIRGFRESSPYIHRFRGKTFVIVFGGEVLADGSFSSIASDIALLRSLGIGVVLVCGAGPQIEERMKSAGMTPVRTWAGPVVTRDVMPEILRAVGEVRFLVEAALSRGVSDSPMSGAEVRVTGGNLVVSRPLGVIDGIDHHFYGTPRHIRSESIRRFLDDGMVVLLPPLGVSLSGDMFLLSAEDVAQEAAISLSASKVLFLVDEPMVQGLPEEGKRELTDRDIALLLSGRSSVRTQRKDLLERASKMVGAGVERVHFVDRHRDGALLLELFTRDGCGTLVSSDPFEAIRPALPSDVPGILDLIRPLETKGILVDRSREAVETDVTHYAVTHRDEKIVACAALYPYPDERTGELACLAVHPDYRKAGRATHLLSWCEKKALSQGLDRLFVLSTQSREWFIERGFIASSVEDLPLERKKAYNPVRKSHVLFKKIDGRDPGTR